MNRSSSIVQSAAIGYSGLFAVTLLLAWWQGRLPGMFPSPVWPGTGVNLLIGGVLAVGVVSASAAFRGTFDWARRMDEEFRFVLGDLRPREALILAVASGVAEEAFFRGLMQPAFGLPLTSIVFGLLHYPANRRLIPWTVIAIVLGFVLGIVYRETASLLAVAFAHVSINFVELLNLGRGNIAIGPPSKSL